MAHVFTSDNAESERTEPARLLGIYLRDHLAGANGGVDLAERCRRNNEGTEYEAILADLAQEIREDRETLRSIVDGLGIQPSRFKAATAAVVEVVARLKSNGRLIRYSPSSRVIEFEALAAGIAAKRSLWRALAAVGPGVALATDSHKLADLEERATSQLDRLAALHERACAEAFRIT